MKSPRDRDWSCELPALPFGESHAKEKTRGGELSAIGKQTMAQAYSAMDYYFDHLKKTVASAPSGGTEFGEKVKAYAEQEHFRHPRIREGADLRQGYPGYTANSDGIHAVAIGSVWRAG